MLCLAVDGSTKESSISPERPESTNFVCFSQEPDGVPRRKESFTRLYDSTKHSGATDVGSLFDCPTVVVPGSRPDSLMTRAQGRPKEDDVRPKIVDARSCDPSHACKRHRHHSPET